MWQNFWRSTFPTSQTFLVFALFLSFCQQRIWSLGRKYFAVGNLAGKDLRGRNDGNCKFSYLPPICKIFHGKMLKFKMLPDMKLSGGNIWFYTKERIINPPSPITLSSPSQSKGSHGRYNLTIQSMIEFCLKMIQFNYWFKRKLSKIIQFNFQFKRRLSGFNSKEIFNEKKNKDLIQKKINSKLFLANSIQ